LCSVLLLGYCMIQFCILPSFHVLSVPFPHDMPMDGSP